MDYVFANTSTVVAAAGGGTTRVHEGEVWAADDPVVKDNPGLFGDKPTKIRRTTNPPAWTPQEEAPPVEQATAEPGEKRPAKRTAKRA